MKQPCCRRNRSQMFYRINVLEKLEKFTGKYQRSCTFLVQLQVKAKSFNFTRQKDVIASVLAAVSVTMRTGTKTHFFSVYIGVFLE